MVLRVRGYALPDGEYVDLYADGDRWTDDPVRGADLVAEGWLLPGLVDAHTHPGAEMPGDPLDERMLRAHLHEHVDAGVTAIRSPGLAGEPPAWFGKDQDVPRAWHAGPWLAQHGQFFDGWGRRADHDELPAVAAAQAARTGWAKVIADWQVEDEPVPVGVLTAVAAGVDSVEHGMCLDPELLTRMAEQGMALTPTLSAIQAGLAGMRHRPDGPRKDWYVGGAGAHADLVAAAAEAGVRVLAGTDSLPHGRISDEVLALADAGMRPHEALAAASWQARAYLGLPGLESGAPADAVIYPQDPRLDLTRLSKPTAVILRGRCVRGC